MAEDKLDNYIKKGLLFKGNDDRLKSAYITTGISLLDEVLGGKGLMMGRMYLVVGDTSSGKTYVAQTVTKEFQKLDLPVMYIDLEYVYDSVWWESCGVDVDKLFIARPSSGEEMIDIIVDAIDGGFKLIIVDSIAAVISAAEMEEGAEYNPYAMRARLLSGKIPKFLGKASLNKATILAVNQVRESMKMGQPESYPGGLAQRFYSSAILRLRRNGWIKDGDKRTGFHINIECVKNKIGQPYESCDVDFKFVGGIDLLGMLITEAIDNHIIKKAGPYYSWGDVKLLGMNNLRNYFLENEKERAKLDAAVV